jgi:hypothetical protein
MPGRLDHRRDRVWLNEQELVRLGCVSWAWRTPLMPVFRGTNGSSPSSTLVPGVEDHDVAGRIEIWVPSDLGVAEVHRVQVAVCREWTPLMGADDEKPVGVASRGSRVGPRSG